jgi:hypothetical protein
MGVEPLDLGHGWGVLAKEERIIKIWKNFMKNYSFFERSVLL